MTSRRPSRSQLPARPRSQPSADVRTVGACPVDSTTDRPSDSVHQRLRLPDLVALVAHVVVVKDFGVPSGDKRKVSELPHHDASLPMVYC